MGKQTFSTIMACTGASYGAVTAQMMSRGAMDYSLTGEGEVTYWRMKHDTCTNFALEIIGQDMQNVQFGKTGSVTLTRTGDLIHRQFLSIDLPGLFPIMENAALVNQPYAYVLDKTVLSGIDIASSADGQDSIDNVYMPQEELDTGLTGTIRGFYAHYTNAVGFAMIKAASLVIGNTVMDTLEGEYMYMLDELMGKSGKRLQDQIGKFETREQLIAYSRLPNRLYVPLPFWYTQVAGNALSMVSMSLNGVVLNVTFRELKDLIIVSNANVKVNKATATGADSGVLLSAQDLSVCVMTEFVFLDLGERAKFNEGMFDQLITQMQARPNTGMIGNATLQINLPFNHPVIELIFAVRLSRNAEANKWFDFSRVAPSSGRGYDADKPASILPPLMPQTEGTFDALNTVVPDDAGRYALNDYVTVHADPIVSVSLRVNSIPRFNTQEAKFFRQAIPGMHHSAIPKNFIYNYSFALFPEEPSPSASLNWGRVDSVDMTWTMHPSLIGEALDCFVYARNWNVFSYTDHTAGTLFL